MDNKKGYVSTDYIIDRLHRDFDFDNKHIIDTHLIEWIGDALMRLYKEKLLITKITDCNSQGDPNIEISNYEGVLPCDLIEFGQARLVEDGEDCFTTLKYSTDLFIQRKKPYEGEKKYTLQNGRIYTNFESGSLEIVYKAMMLDSNGKPMIPDFENVIDYVVKFLAKRVSMKLWMKQLMSDKVYYMISGQCDTAWLKANNNLKMPSLEEFNSFIFEWNRISRTPYHAKYNYRDLGNHSK